LPSLQGIAEDEGNYLFDFALVVLTKVTALDGLSPLSLQNRPPADVFSTPPKLEGDLITLTLLPRSRWQTLLKLEVIQVGFNLAFCLASADIMYVQQRNKPKEPPKAPEKAPFFLPTLPGVEPRFVTGQNDRQTQPKKESRRLEHAAANTESVFLQKLKADSPDGDCKLWILS